ncbi:MAG TPA: carboxypeptidase-like regulatory domain-containing protein, partial [Chitinophagaceae bacterium]|nr:carboxypeptidase-like regulatory domain-containing protein [Chitinophagaceae bacterium]
MKSLIFVSLIFIVTSAAAQNAGKIEGSVVSKSSGAEGATVVLLRANDSAAIKKIAANKDGQYRFENIANGKYIIGATAVGHQRSYSQVIELKPGQEA